jgi:hypothetical protein
MQDLTVTGITVSGGVLMAGTYTGVFTSTDQSASWIPMDSADTWVVQDLIQNETRTYAALLGGLLVSDNSGMSWQSAGSGLTTGNIYSLAADKGKLYAGTLDGISVSIDNGEHWTSANNTALSPFGVNRVIVNQEIIYAGTNGGGIFSSSDGGANWNSINNGLTSLNITALLLFESKLFAGTSDKGIFISSDNGASWTSSSTSIDSNIQVLASSGSVILAGT